MENNNKITAFEEYCSTYKDRLERFLKECPEALEIDFIELEQRKYLSEISAFERLKCIISDGENAVKINGQTHRANYYLNKKSIFCFYSKYCKIIIQLPQVLKNSNF